MVETRDVPVKMTANAGGKPDRKRDRSMTEDELFEFITAEAGFSAASRSFAGCGMPSNTFWGS